MPIHLENCSHPARLKGGDGVLRCLCCGAEIEPTTAREPPKEAVTSASRRRIGFDAEGAERPRRGTRKAKAE